MAKKNGRRPKIVANPDTRDRRALDEAAIEKAWRESGSLHVIADRLAFCRMRNEPPPEWVHRALLDFANTKVDGESYAKQARSLVRYVAVREAHDREGLSWEKAAEWAADRLRGESAGASPETMWKEYKKKRKALRAAGVCDDDPGYRRIDLSDKAPG
jgi:hypothetical protein